MSANTRKNREAVRRWIRTIACAMAITLASSVFGWSTAMAQADSARIDRPSDDLGLDGLKRRGDGSIDDDQFGAFGDRRDDDIGPDGLKRRGDGSIDDDQPGQLGDHHGDDTHERGHREHRIKLEDTDVRTRNDDGSVTRERTRVTVHPVTGERRERTRTEVVNPDGSVTKVQTERRIAADGTILRELTSTRDRAARGDRSERGERGDRSERSDRGDRAERGDRGDRGDRADRSDRSDRGDRSDRDDRSERSERSDRSDSSS